MSNLKFSRKLNLNKQVLANLSKDELKTMIGGSGTTVDNNCTDWPPTVVTSACPTMSGCQQGTSNGACNGTLNTAECNPSKHGQ